MRWAASLKLPRRARLQVDSLLAVMAALEAQLDVVDTELRRFARNDARSASPETMLAARRCRRSTGSGRSSPATCWPRSVRPAASTVPTRSPGWPASTPSSTSPATAVAAANSPKQAHRTFAGHSTRPPCTRTGQPPPTSPSTGPPASGATRPSPDSPLPARSANEPSTPSASSNSLPDQGWNQP